MSENKKTIFVFESRAQEPQMVGILYADCNRGKEYYSFEYNETYLRGRKTAIRIDPELVLLPGRQYNQGKQNFGAFSDASPDRWGRTLLDRKERIRARSMSEKPRKLTESDYLLGVSDKTRMGALRFSLSENGPFLAEDEGDPVPPWTTLRSLEEASRQFEKDENIFEDKWLNLLLKPGSSLGGARPKATVQDVNGDLWIAKFPSKHDSINSGAWEKIVHDLALRCGLHVPPSALETFTKAGSTFLVKRFDRTGILRNHFASAMTMLGKTDGASASDGTSYLEIAEFIRAEGTRPQEDLAELWKRIVFNMAVSNTDDHLRNHGFLWSGGGWRLSPAFDMNPEPAGDTLSLNISAEDNTIDIELAVETCSYYGIEKAKAKETAAEICRIVHDGWEGLARRYGVGRGETELMRSAFLASEWGN